MKTSSLALLIGSAVAVIAGGTALGVSYARFQKAQKAINGSTTIGDMLAAKVVPDESEKEVDENESTDNSSDESN